MEPPGEIPIQTLQEIQRIFSSVTNNEFDSVDPKLRSLASTAATLGPNVIDVIILGLSRPITPTRKDVQNLVSQWERRDKACCFNGSEEDFLSQKDTIVVAVSYKHDDFSRWNRKGETLVSKFSDHDQREFADAIVGLGKHPKTQNVIVWCDQIISTRLTDGATNQLGWYNAGLLPYLCMPVLTLSTNFTDDVLENRIWIKAERSLGRLGRGLLTISDACLGVLSNIPSNYTANEGLKTISVMMLSGYWPADTGHWANDYQEMKLWALGLVCRGKKLLELPLFDKIKPIDNLEILENLPDLVIVPRDLEDQEWPYYTDDPFFYLKATAWNLSLEEVWSRDRSGISHNLGYLGGHCRFSWWIERKSEAIFGCLITIERACLVLAVRHQSGYKLMRCEGNPTLYVHMQLTAVGSTKELLAEAARKCGVEVNIDEEWLLLFCCDESSDSHLTDIGVTAAMGDVCREADASVPLRFVGMTTQLYRAALATAGETSPAMSPERFVALVEEWNDHVRGKYDNWVSVLDTRSGPAWLEGYDEEHISFGFLDYLTRVMFKEETGFSDRCVRLPSKWEAVQEIKRAAGCGSEDVKVIENELFGGVTEETCDSALTTRDVARFMINGGMTSGFVQLKVSAFLLKTSEYRGYWSTDIFCRDGKLQVMFKNKMGEVRIMQRETKLVDFVAGGIVRPEDSKAVAEIAEVLDEEPAVYRGYYFKERMDNTVSRNEMMSIFPGCVKDVGMNRKLCLVDMSVSDAEGREIGVVHKHNCVDEGGGSAHDERSRIVLEMMKSIVHKTSKESNVSIPQVDGSFEDALASSRQRYEQRLETSAMAKKAMEEHVAQMRYWRKNRSQEDDE